MLIPLDSVLHSSHVPVLLAAAAALGFLHTVLGPDHYLPFVMMARAHRWSRRKTAGVTALCGVGHVASSIAVGALLGGGGMALSQWKVSGWAVFHERRGSLAADLLLGVGVAFLVWGFIRARRRRVHAHLHAHEDGTVHSHPHDHSGPHLHVHGKEATGLTPWVLFTLFVFGPCESIIPLMLASSAIAGPWGMMGVALVFAAVTVLTILGAVGLLLRGISRISFGRLDRWATAMAGASLILCGSAIRWIGV